MVFSVYSETQDFLESFITKKQELAKKIAMEEEEEAVNDKKRRFGTLVTKENFIEWRNKFEMEFLQSVTLSDSATCMKKQTQSKNKIIKQKKTGKEIFSSEGDSISGLENNKLSIDEEEPITSTSKVG